MIRNEEEKENQRGTASSSNQNETNGPTEANADPASDTDDINEEASD